MTKEQVSDLVERWTGGGLSRRQFIQRALGLGLSTPAIAALLAETAVAAPKPGAAAAASRYQADARTLVIADNMSGGLWLSLDPGKFYENDPTVAMNVIYETLYDIPDTTKPDNFVPLLAHGMPALSADGKVATIKLRQGVKFQTTGNLMTADDWIFSWARLKNLKASPSYLTGYWDKVEAVDPATLKITLPEPNPALVAILTSTPLSVTDSKTVKANGGTDAADANKTDKATDYINAHSVGTGPYRVSQWDISSEVIVERNPDYWGEPAKLDRIIWRNIADANSQLQAVKAGEADIAYALDPDAVGQVKDDPNLQLLTSSTINLEYLALHNGASPGGPLAKKEVRQAISDAIDYDGIKSGLLHDAATRPATVVPLPMPGSEAVQSLAYKTDVAKAQQLFDAAGVGAVEISLSFRSDGTGQGGLNEPTLATKLKADIERIKGLKVKLVPMDATQWITDYRASKLQFTLAPWGPDYPDVLSYVGPFGGSSGAVAKRVGYSNPQVDALLKQSANEPDASKRAQAYTDIQKQLIADAPYVVLYQPIDQRAARKTVQGVTNHFFYNIQLRFASKTG